MNNKITYTAVLMTAALFALTACSAPTATSTSTSTATPSPTSTEPDTSTFEECLAANSQGKFWGHHENMWCHLYKYVNEQKQISLRFYQDDKNYIWIFEDGNITYGGQDSYLYVVPEGDKTGYRADLTDSDELYAKWYKSIHDRDYIVLNDKYTLLETSEKDGVFEALVEINDPETCSQLAESEKPDLPEDFVYEDGVFFRYRYRFDAENKDLVGYFHYSVGKDGSVRTLAEAEYTFDGAKYDPFAEGEPFHEYKAMQADPERSRKVTVIFDPDTADENRREFVVPKTAAFDVYYGKGEQVKELFTDRALTVPYADDGNAGDLELYARTGGSGT